MTTEFLKRDSVAWGIVKLDYSAFYAGHALIPLLGEGCSHFDRQHVARLHDLGIAFGRVPGFRIESGLYRCVLSGNSTVLTCARARGTVGGTHESFWEIFGNLVQVVADGVLTGALLRADAQAVFLQLENFGEIMRRRSGYSWLSVIRNDLQYRQQFGVWYPARIGAGDRAVWEGVVHVFDLNGHPTATRAYAWSSPIEGSDKRRFFAVLHIPPITSPLEAVRAAIVHEYNCGASSDD